MKRKSPHGNVSQPNGTLRASQLVTTFGPGAMYDLVDKAVIIKGLDAWRNEFNEPGREVKDARLQHYLAFRFREWNRTNKRLVELFEPPLSPGNLPEWQRNQKQVGVGVYEFPRNGVCQECSQLLVLGDFELEEKKGRHVHAQCRAKRGGREPLVVPARFVAACPKGHLEEFPWRSFVHQEPSVSCRSAPLKLIQGAAGDIGDVKVQCLRCRKERSMLHAQGSSLGFRCQGKRPWLEAPNDEECENGLRLLVRTASDAYFPVIGSALSLPSEGNELAGKIAADWGDVFAEVTDVELISSFRRQPAFAKKYRSFSDHQILVEVQRYRSGQRQDKEKPLREAEWELFGQAEESKPTDHQDTEEMFLARKCPQASALLPSSVSLTLVHRLREVRAQVGFSRLYAMGAEGFGELPKGQPLAALSGEADGTIRLPAVEIWGEGLLFTLSEDAVSRWEKRQAVQERVKKLKEGYEAWSAQTSHPDAGKPAFRGGRYYLLHTLSHLLISAISLECGYAASAIRERLYCSVDGGNGGPPMAGILLSTGSPGSEGTLGGLVDQHRQIKGHFRKARELAQLCSNDPICSLHNPADAQTERYLQGASCHGCVHVAECSCEAFNDFLDRALVFPTLENTEAAFFQGELPW